MKKNLNHPGEFLLEEVEYRKLSKKEFASSIGIKPSNLSEIFKGKRNISPKLAVRIEKVWGIKAEYCIALQIKYDLNKERSKR